MCDYSQDDDRLDKLLEMLEKKAPGPEKKKTKSAAALKLAAKSRPASARFADMRTQQVRRSPPCTPTARLPSPRTTLIPKSEGRILAC
jgi:hypothetical protein